MESNIKGLVSAGHEMASELKAECGAVDMRSVAKLISDLATQLEVQLVRANALAAENAAMHETIEAVRSVADNSSGIAGWHLNGDIATWEEILPEINDIETQATDAFLAEIERKAIRKFINRIEHILRDKLSPYDTEEMLEAMRIFLEEQGVEQK
ncbi:TPA: hypothetical protein ACWZKJ_003210 [Escherichia coli]|uniref:hypothetical protein n=1 Tax=Escherichia coli TaxID=562 RepID=UPI000E5A3943|nr:hypothetical protein [Escherichia coli]EFH3095653.1 hypothetical protein [Escherichia coli]EKI5916659.1 hypothetical protein [Escherichia coli]RID04705.1 hypothetical protein D1876_02500 [Escherichia coli]HAM3939554.1 hypothetical protein [Escherichia coli]HAN8739948.1 hypothetical protein [Escherichia coli]